MSPNLKSLTSALSCHGMVGSAFPITSTCPITSSFIMLTVRSIYSDIEHPYPILQIHLLSHCKYIFVVRRMQ